MERGDFMEFSKQDIIVTKIRYANLKQMEFLFEKEFGEEINMDIVRARMRRLRQFYGVLLPFRLVSPWVRSFWNIFIFQVKGTFAGFIQLSHMGHRNLHLDFIAVSKPYRGKGLGRYILHGLVKEFADRKSYGIILEVRLDNPAYDLYQSLGFSSQSQIIHYERKFGKGEFAPLLHHPLLRMERLRAEDRQYVYELYCLNIPEKLKQVVMQDKRSFWPNMFTRQMVVIKNKILKNSEYAYVIKIEHKIIGTVNIKSYEAAQYHILTLYIHPKHELQRKQILQQVIAFLSDRYRSGVISTTIYDDLISKQHDLEAVGFEKKEAYFMMYRKPLTSAHASAEASEKNKQEKEKDA